jgi:hypothetical protein
MADCLSAWKDGEDSAAADAGGILLAEAISNLDVCARFAVMYAKYLSG